jgi:hypothetical protein
MLLDRAQTVQSPHDHRGDLAGPDVAHQLVHAGPGRNRSLPARYVLRSSSDRHLNPVLATLRRSGPTAKRSPENARAVSTMRKSGGQAHRRGSRISKRPMSRAPICPLGTRRRSQSRCRRSVKVPVGVVGEYATAWSRRIQAVGNRAGGPASMAAVGLRRGGPVAQADA